MDYISLTDIARYKNPHEPTDIIKNWLRTKSTIEFLGIWEKIHTSNFKGVEFDPLQKEAGNNSFVLAEVINLAVFGQTAKEWKQLHLNEKGSIRDHANLEQLIILANLESINALLIRNGLTQRERLIQLNQTAIQQMKSLLRNPSLKQLKNSTQ